MTCELAGDVLAIAPRHRIKEKTHTNNKKWTSSQLQAVFLQKTPSMK